MEQNHSSRLILIWRLCVALLLCLFCNDLSAQSKKLIGTANVPQKFGAFTFSSVIYTIDENGVVELLHQINPDVEDHGRAWRGLTRVGDKFWAATRRTTAGGGIVFSFDPQSNTFQKHAELTANEVIDKSRLHWVGGRLWGIGQSPGTLFGYTPGDSKVQVSHRFGSGEEGFQPMGLTVVDGLLWGVCGEGGAHGEGTVFNFDPSTGVVKKLHDFKSADKFVEGSLIHAYGRVYGVIDGNINNTSELAAGQTEEGQIFSLATDGSDYRVEYVFDQEDAADFSLRRGRTPAGLLAHDGKLWGVTQDPGVGKIYYLDLATGEFNSFHSFTGQFANRPDVPLTYYNGKIWGTTRNGGDERDGTIFSIDPQTLEVKLEHTFDDQVAYFPDYASLQPVALTALTIVEPLADLEIEEDAQNVMISLPPRYADLETGSTDLNYKTILISDERIYPGNRITSDKALNLTPYLNRYGTTKVVLEVSDSEGAVVRDTMNVNVLPVADLPTVSSAITSYGQPTTTGLVVTKNIADGDEVSHFQVTDIQNGRVFLNDGVTQVKEGVFVTFEEGIKGLIFNPGIAGSGSFMVQASMGNQLSGLGGEKAKAAITIEKATLKVTANSFQINKNDAIPALTLSYDGFMSGETENTIGGPYAYTMATMTSDPGLYHINLEGGEATNYEFTKVSGFITIIDPEAEPLDETITKLIGTATTVNANGAFVDGLGVFSIDEDKNLEDLLSIATTDQNLGQPRWGVIESEGLLWGVTDSGGANGFGIIFHLRKDGTSFTKVHDFTSSTGEPSSGLFESNGYLWGGTKAGFGQNTGAIYRLKTNGTAFEILHEFNSDDGWTPSGLIEAEGKLWGMTAFGGSNGVGVIFSIKPDGADFQKIFDFPAGYGKPRGELIYVNGRFWATTMSSNFEDPKTSFSSDDFGTIFSIMPDGSDYDRIWTYRNSQTSSVETMDGRHPFGDLVLAEGKLWGLTPYGGVNWGGNPFGTLFHIDPLTSKFTKVYNLDSFLGSYPKGDLVFSEGLLWGLASAGGTNDVGTVFTYDPQTFKFDKVGDLGALTGGSPEFNGFAMIEVDRPLIANIPDITINEDAGEQELDLTAYFSPFAHKVNGTAVYAIEAVSNASLFGRTLLNNGVLTFEPGPHKNGIAEITVKLSGDNGEVGRGTFKVTINPVIDGIEVSEMSVATYGTLGREPIFITRNELDGPEVSHFKVLTIDNAKLYRSNGTIQVEVGDFVDFNLASAGLQILPLTVGEVSFSVMASKSANDVELGGEPKTFVVDAKKADLYVRANDQAAIYGDALAPPTFSYDGFVNGDDAADITPPSISLNAALGSNAGEYPIVLSGGTSANYSLILENGICTIRPKILNVRANDIYRNSAIFSNAIFTLAYSGFVLGQDESVLTTQPTIDWGVRIPAPGDIGSEGTYELTVVGGSAQNYLLNRVSGTYLIDYDTPETGSIGDPEGRRGKFVLVGTTTSNGGSLFSVDAQFTNSVWHTFDSFIGGQTPFTGIVEAEGKVWGTTSVGGTNGTGVIYSVSIKEREFKQEHEFDFSDGAQPNGRMLLVADRLWGTTSQGGVHNQGVIYSIKTDGSDFRNEYHFDGTTGAFPANGLIKVGTVLWGMTTYGGANERGVIYRLNTDGSGFEVLHEFGVHKGIPFGDLILAKGKVWGMTRESPGPQQFFVTGNAGDNGAVFSIETDGTNYTEVHDFQKIDNQDIGLKGGRHPHGSLVEFEGALWGMTTYGGQFANSNLGTIFKLDISNATPVFSQAYNFTAGLNGRYPKGGLAVFEDALWGMTTESGSNNLGTVFKFDPNASVDSFNPFLQFSNSTRGTPQQGSFVKVFVDLIPTLSNDIPDYEVKEGTDKIVLNLDSYFTDQDGNAAFLDYEVFDISNTSLFGTTNVTDNRLSLLFANDQVGSATVSVRARGVGNDTVEDTFTVTVLEEADQPQITNSETVYGNLSNSGLVVTRNINDGETVSHFRVSGIQNGKLFLQDGVTQVLDQSFITAEQGLDGLRFLATSINTGAFEVQAATGAEIADLNGEKSKAFIEVSKAPLKVKAEDKTMLYGRSLPRFTLSYSGFVLSQGPGVITDPIISTVATATSDTHTYLLEVSGGSASNYDLILENGLLIVEKAPLQVIADNKVLAYGQELPEFTLSYSGLVNTGDEQSFTLPAISATASQGSAVGDYDIQLSGGLSDDYDFQLNPGILKIQKAPLLISADDKEITYGESVPEFTLSFDGFVEGEGVANLVLPDVNSSAPAGPGVGQYGIQLSGGSANNYTITLQSGLLKVNKAPLKVTTNDLTMKYGDDLPELTLSYEGFIPGDDQSGIVAPTISTSASSTAEVGNYTINLSNGSADNYELELQAGTLTIEKAPLTITADNQEITYGNAVPVLSVGYDGFKNGDSNGVITGLQVTTDATNTSVVGDYGVSLSGANATNYEITLVNGKLTVVPAELIVIAEDKSMTYGGELLAFSLNYAGFVNGDDESKITAPKLQTTATSTSPIGAYAINLADGTADNYNFRYIDGILAIKKAPLTITADDKPLVFGDPFPALTMSYEGFVNGENETNVTIPAIATSATAESGFGSYPITLSGGSADNYELTLANGVLQVGKAILKVTADPKEMVYGQAVPSLTISYEGFQDGEDENDIVPPFIFTSVTSNTDAGEYPIRLVGGLSNNYIFQFTEGTVNVKKTSLVIKAQEAQITYGDNLPAFTASYTGFVNGQDESVISGLTYSTSASETPKAGTYDIVPLGGEATNYELQYENASLLVNKASLKVTPADQSKGYGEPLPALTFAYSGFVNGETESDIVAPTVSTTATAASNVGAYDISLSGGASDNYSLDFENGTLTINRASLEVKVDAQTTTYGKDLPAFTAQYLGFVNDDNAASVAAQISFITTATPGSPIGVYDVDAVAGALSNYDLTVTKGILTVNKAPLVITAEDKLVSYGQETPDWTLAYTGFVNGDWTDDIEVPSAEAPVTATTAVGKYDIALTGGSAANYDITLQQGICEVSPAVLKVTATSVELVYGESLPDLSYTYSGFVNGQDESILNDVPQISTTALATSGVGTYPIALSGGAAENYTVSLEPGTLNIAPANLTVFVGNQEMTYGGTIPSFVASYSGFVNGEDESVITPPNVSTQATSQSGVGTYAISLEGGSAGNYSFQLFPGVLTVNKAPLTITADDKQVGFGEDLPTLTLTYEGFVNGDDTNDITLPAISTAAQSTSGFGIYAIKLLGGSAQNYELNLVDGKLQIGKAVLKVTAVNQQMSYGQAVPGLTLAYEGFRDGDDENDITPPFASTSVTSNSITGEYPITLSGGVSDNYILELTDGVLTVVPAPLIVTANDIQVTYGDAIPQFGVSYSGFVNGQDASIISGLTVTSNAGFRAGAGDYDITPANGQADNYSLQYVIGNLKVKKAVLTVLAEDQNMIYGESLPTLTLFYSGYVNGEGVFVFNSPVSAQTDATSRSNVGSYDIRLSGGATDNYELNLIAGTLNIGRAPLFAIANAQTMEYGQPVPALTIRYDGFKNAEGPGDITPPSISTDATSQSNIGEYTISLSGGAALNYEFLLQNAPLTIVKARQTITFSLNGLEVIPGQTFPLNGTSDSGLPLTYVSSDESLLTIEGNVATILNSGVVTITASQAGDDNREAAVPVGQQLTITSILEPGLEEELDILYPNPAADFFQVKEPVERIELFDQQGTLVKRFEGTFSQYDVKDLKRGVYTAFFYKDGKVGMSRMIIWR